MDNEDPAQRLGHFVRVRRKELKLTQADVQNADGPSPATLRLIEAGKHADLRRSTVEPLERILGWEPGSVQAILDGGSPIYEIHIDDNLREKFRIAPGKITSGGMPRPPRGPSRPVTEAEILGIDESTVDLSISPETGGGVDSLRAAVTRSAILKIPEAERSAEETSWLAAYEATHPRQLDPRIYPTGEKRPPEAIFDDWQAARNRMLNVVLEYAATRKISFQAAEEELADVQQMVSDVQLGTGRPWTPPWNPGAEFHEGETPWKREWWAIIEQNLDGVSRIGSSWDIEEVRRNREGDEKRKTDWDAQRERKLREYYRDQDAAALALPGPQAAMVQHLESMFERLSAVDPVLDLRSDLQQLVEAIRPTMDTPAGIRVFIESIERLLIRSQENLHNYRTDPAIMREIAAMQREVEQYANLTVVDAPSGRLGTVRAAARTAPPDYIPGRSEQGESGGEENQYDDRTGDGGA